PPLASRAAVTPAPPFPSTVHLRLPQRSTHFPYTTLFRSGHAAAPVPEYGNHQRDQDQRDQRSVEHLGRDEGLTQENGIRRHEFGDRKSTRLNSSHVKISYAVFCLKKKTNRTASTDDYDTQ